MTFPKDDYHPHFHTYTGGKYRTVDEQQAFLNNVWWLSDHKILLNGGQWEAVEEQRLGDEVV